MTKNIYKNKIKPPTIYSKAKYPMIYHTNKYFKMQHHTVTKFYKTVDIRRNPIPTIRISTNAIKENSI